jgi:hypothetical protein
MRSVVVVSVLLFLCDSVYGRQRHLQHDPSGYTYHEHSLAHPYMANGMEIPYWGKTTERR